MENKKSLKLIIAGGRDFDPTKDPKIKEFIDEFFTCNLVDEIVCGMAEGADRYGMYYGVVNNYEVIEMSADWEKYGARAGMVRNKEMGDYADHLIAIWDGKSSGTKHMIDYMKEIGKPFDIILYNQDETLKEWF